MELPNSIFGVPRHCTDDLWPRRAIIAVAVCQHCHNHHGGAYVHGMGRPSVRQAVFGRIRLAWRNDH